MASPLCRAKFDPWVTYSPETKKFDFVKLMPPIERKRGKEGKREK